MKNRRAVAIFMCIAMGIILLVSSISARVRESKAVRLLPAGRSKDKTYIRSIPIIGG